MVCDTPMTPWYHMISHHIPSAFEPGANLRVKDQQKLMPLQLALANGHLHLAPWIRWWSGNLIHLCWDGLTHVETTEHPNISQQLGVQHGLANQNLEMHEEQHTCYWWVAHIRRDSGSLACHLKMLLVHHPPFSSAQEFAVVWLYLMHWRKDCQLVGESLRVLLIPVVEWYHINKQGVRYVLEGWWFQLGPFRSWTVGPFRAQQWLRFRSCCRLRQRRLVASDRNAQCWGVGHSPPFQKSFWFWG